MKKTVLLFIVAMLAMTLIQAQNSTTNIDDADQAKLDYSGTWVHGVGGTDPYYNNTVSYSNQENATIRYEFIGYQIELYASKASHHGIVRVAVDAVGTNVDLYSSTRQNFVKVYSSGILSYGRHQVVITVTGLKNSAASNTYAIVDYLKIFTTPALNIANGFEALSANTTGYNNTAMGYRALSSNTEAMDNTALGASSLTSNSIGTENTAVGSSALKGNTSGTRNIAVGHNAMLSNNTGMGNVAIGNGSLNKSVSSTGNTAIGHGAMLEFNSGGSNSAFGYNAMGESIGGTWNNAFGSHSLRKNSSGAENDAVGSSALYNNTTGSRNVSVGYSSLASNVSGNQNVAMGWGALSGVENGSNNTGIGYKAGAIFPSVGMVNSTAIGSEALVTASNQVRIGNTYVTSIGGQVSWSTLSDGRFKKDIKEDVSGLDFISKLRPVSYTVDKEAVDKFLRIPDSLRTNSAEARKKTTRQTGFVAQEVEAVIKKTGYVFHGVETPQSENDHYSIRYAEFVVPLVKAVQELNDRDAEQKQMIEDMKKEILTLKEGLQANNAGGLLSEKLESVLYQNNPNPFSTDTEIKMEVSESAVNAVVMVYNLEGKQLKDVRVQGRGKTSVKIGGSELNAGMYLYALIVDGKVVDTKRMILTK